MLGCTFFLVRQVVGRHHEKDSREDDGHENASVTLQCDNSFRVVFHPLGSGLGKFFEPIRFLYHVEIPSVFPGQTSLPHPGQKANFYT